MSSRRVTDTVSAAVRILYLHQFFMTRAGGGGTRSYEFARHLVGAGPRGDDGNRGAGDDPPRTVEGIEVVEVGGAYSDYMRATADRATGAGSAAFGALRRRAPPPRRCGPPRPDVVFATSPAAHDRAARRSPPSRRHRAPLVFEVRDLWPRAPIEMGALRNPAARRVARALERAAYRAAAHVVALSPGIARRRGRRRRARRSGCTMIPNASDLDLFSPDVDPGDLRERLGLGGAFVCSYFGTMGEANDLTQVVDAATLLRDRGENGVAFVLQGEGKRRPAIEDEVRRRGLRNVVLLPAGDKESAARLAAASDACMTIFKDVPVLATNSPNKLFDTFAAGRAGDREHRRLAARARGAQRARACSRARATRATWPTRCSGCATTPS